MSETDDFRSWLSGEPTAPTDAPPATDETLPRLPRPDFSQGGSQSPWPSTHTVRSSLEDFLIYGHSGPLWRDVHDHH